MFQDPQASLHQARKSIQDGAYDSARKQLEALVVQEPENVAALKLLAKADLLLDDMTTAEEVLGRLHRLIPKDFETLSLLGRLYQQTNRFDLAVRFLQGAQRASPEDILVQTSLGYVYLGLGNLESASATFKKAVYLSDRSARPLAQAHAAYGIFLLRLNKVKEAEAQIQRALKLDPRDKTTIEAKHALDVRLRTENRPNYSGEILNSPFFVDISKASGIGFRLEHAPTSSKHLIETMPGGVAVLDYDQDGYMDLYFANGAESPSLKKSHSKFWNRLYHNDHHLKFSDITESAGVAGVGYTIGAAAGDFNNDGYPDLFVVGVDQNILYVNQRDGTFRDMTLEAGLSARPRRWGIHAAWFDYDRDGWLDLLVINYCQWDPQKEPYCGDNRPGYRTYCHPSKYLPLPNQLYHNNRNGTFSDISLASEIGRHLGKGMGAAVADFDLDGWPDVFVANDTEPNFLFWNQKDGTFREVANAKGVAFNQFGSAVSSMGVDFRDFDNDGRPDIFVTTLSNEGFLLFRNNESLFDDVSDSAGIGLNSLPFSGWSNLIADFNNDGWKDLFSANGHVLDNIELKQSRTYRQPNSLFLNLGNGKFQEVSESTGSTLASPAAHRGAASVDLDNDGRLDLVVTALGESPKILQNQTNEQSHWLEVQLQGQTSNRLGEGALLRLEMFNGRIIWNHASASAGYASSSDPRVHFGLGKDDRIRNLSVYWPSGKEQVLHTLLADQIRSVKEPR